MLFRFLVLIVLGLFYACASDPIVDAHKKEDKKRTETTKQSRKVLNNDSSTCDELRTQLKIQTDQSTSLQTENNSLFSQNQKQRNVIEDQQKRLKEAEWAEGFVGAFKWVGVGLFLVIVLLLVLWLLKSGVKIPFIS